ncbi:hypothetical protein CC79DRAFT_1354812 [Sarocladium strictum]
MTRIGPRGRRRAKAQRVRTGCATCKFRRVKCDEGRPACSRCISTGRQCDRYESRSHGPNLVPAAAVAATIPPSVRLCVDPREMQPLQFYIEQTIDQFSTFFRDELWSAKVLQLAATEPCVRHALVAMALHHRHLSAQSTDVDMEFAARQQILAIRELKSPAQPASVSLLHLTTCCIFICTEILKGHHHSAIYFFKAGHGMIQELRSSRMNGHQHHTQDTTSMIQSIEALFARFAIQVALMVGDVIPALSMAEISREYQQDPSHIPVITSAIQARKQFIDLVNYSMANSGGKYVLKDESCLYLIRAWLAALRAYVAQQDQDTLSNSDRRAFVLLELQARYLLLAARMREQVEYGLVLDPVEDTRELGALIDLAARTHEPEKGGPEQFKPATRFHLDLGVVPILFSIASSSRDVQVSRRAVQLLLSMNVQEGIWSSNLTGRVARRMLELMESETSDDVGPSDMVFGRIMHVEVHFKPGTEALISYQTHGGVTEEVIVW